MTVAEIRRKNVYKLAERSKDFEKKALEEIEKARHAMNSFYRYAGFSVNKFYFENDYNRYNEKKANELDKRDKKWMKRINNYLEPFNACIQFNGIYPSICDLEARKRGKCNDLFLTSWY